MKKKVIIIISVILALAASLAVINCFLPVKVDTIGYGDELRGEIYSQYHDELTDEYYNGLYYFEKEHISNMKAVEIDDNNHSDIYNVRWFGRTILLEFDVEYDHDEKGHVQERLLFVGKRVWTQKYKWELGIARNQPEREGHYNIVGLE